jgi:hypothetical protein
MHCDLRGKMRRYWCWALLCSLLWNQTGLAAPSASTQSRTAPPAVDPWSKSYSEIIKNERKSQKSRTNIEKIVGGSIAFLLGTYGYYNDPTQNVSSKLIYSVTQSGGILAISSGIVGLSSMSPLTALDDAFLKKGELTYGEYKRVVTIASESQKLAEIQKTAISTGLLASLYGYNAYSERQGNVALRNTFLFLAFNFTLFSSVSFYRWYNFDGMDALERSGKLTVSLQSLNSMRLMVEF